MSWPGFLHNDAPPLHPTSNAEIPTVRIDRACQDIVLVWEFEECPRALVGRQGRILKPDLARYRRRQAGPPQMSET